MKQTVMRIIGLITIKNLKNKIDSLPLAEIKKTSSPYTSNDKKCNSMRKYLILLIVLIINDCTFAQTHDTIKFVNVMGLMKVPIQINGIEHYFIFDTGAECTVIREDEGDKLDKTNSTTDTLNDSFDKVTIQTKYFVKSFKIGCSNLNNQSLVAFPNSSFFNCLGIEGVLGVDIIKQFDWLIDFENQYLIKIDTSSSNKDISDYFALNFYENGFRPRIKLRIGDKIIDLLFDSGSNTNQLDSGSFQTIKKDIKRSYNQISSASGATTFDKQTKESCFLINTQPFNNDSNKYTAEFNSISVGENKIGNTYWGQNKIFLSWTKNKLLFKPINIQNKKTFGITFKVKNDTVIVNSIVYTEQILNLGLHIGDKIKTINGRIFKDNCELLKYQLHNKENNLTIELLNGKQITLNKESIY